MPFDSMTINTYFKLEDEDNEECRALYREPKYDCILKTLTKGDLIGKRALQTKSSHL